MAEGEEPKIGWWDKVPSWAQRGLAVTGFIGGPVGIALSIRDLFDLEGPRWANTLAWAGVLLLYLAIAVVYIQQRHHDRVLRDLVHEHEAELSRYRRNARVAVALPEIQGALEGLRDAAVMIRQGDSAFAYGQALVGSLAQMARTFGSITGAPCRMSIKELAATPDAPSEVEASDVRYFHVQTLWRHDGSGDPRRDAPSPLHANTDFQQVWNPEQRTPYFFANDLDAVPNYQNPHRVGPPEGYDYNAAIVWPVTRQQPDSVGLLGFLCLDSKQKDIFDYEVDTRLGAGYAATLYTVLALRQIALAEAAGDNGRSAAPNA